MAEAGTPLSEREIEVLRLVATGASNQEIARDLVISVNTVKVHLRNIFEKLGVQSRTEATLYAIRHGWVEVNGVTRPAEEAPPEATEPAAPSLQPLAWWQRIYVLLTTLMALALLLLPAFGREERATAAINPISDRPAASVPPIRAETARWTHLADLPTPRTRLALVAYEGLLYAIGGDRESGVTGQVEIYSPETDTWTVGAAKPTPVSNIGAVAVGDRLYVPGGCIGPTSVSDRLEVYSPTDDVWSLAAPMPLPLFAYALATLDGQIYLFGGWDGERFTQQVLVYNPGTDIWTNGPEMPNPRGFAAAAALDRTIYVVGGYDGVSEFADTLAYNVDSQEWTKRASMNVPRGGLGVAVVGNKLYAIGGGWQSYLATNEQYDPARDVWEAFESPVLGEWRNLGVAALGTRIYAVGGWNGDYMQVNEAYQALFRIILPVTQ